MLPCARAVRPAAAAGWACAGPWGFGRGAGQIRCRRIKHNFLKRKLVVRMYNQGARSKFRDILLPPLVSAQELRILLRIDYKQCLQSLGIRFFEGKHYWRDNDGRQFECVARPRVLVPFETAAKVCSMFAMEPRLVDVEPHWEKGDFLMATPPVPVVAVLGHINHGKTTFLDTVSGSHSAPGEPGGITQNLRCFTARVDTGHQAGSGSFDRSRITFVDTPGHEVFEIMRGRAAEVADAAVILVSVEKGAEIQTDEVIQQADRFGVPLVFALNKIDLPHTHIELARAELRRQCQSLFDRGLVSRDFSPAADAALPMSGLKGTGVQEVLGQIHGVLDEQQQVPIRFPESYCLTPGASKTYEHIWRRTVYLVDSHVQPPGVGVVVDLQQHSIRGKLVTVVVKAGAVNVGDYFVCGSAFGRVSHMFSSAESLSEVTTATPGLVVQVCGIRRTPREKATGECAPGDTFMVLQRERAFRVSEYRRRMEMLSEQQASGPPMEFAWEHDAAIVSARSHAQEMDRATRNPEAPMSLSDWQRRRQAIEELGDGYGAPVFTKGSVREFEEPIPTHGELAKRDADDDDYQQILSGWDAPEERPARRSGTRLAAADGEDKPEPHLFVEPLETGSDDEEEKPQQAKGGRRSARRKRQSEDPLEGEKKEWIYYTERKNWQEDAQIDSGRTRLRVDDKLRAEAKAEEEAEKKLQEEREIVNELRQKILQLSPREPETEEQRRERELQRIEERTPTPLPAVGKPVIPIVLKARYIGVFDMLMDELERLSDEYDMRILVVHGGLGDVFLRDVVHAEVEKKYGWCPVYAFQVKCDKHAQEEASRLGIDVQYYELFTDFVDAVEYRCQIVARKRARREEAVSRRKPLMQQMKPPI
mmetsp:Transcript_129980/g.296389  ORF Transcript_129980/g.296389 Transcript_129980/m.296389 type:complete len:875 (+) Transcript_129980:66-2690(+)